MTFETDSKSAPMVMRHVVCTGAGAGNDNNNNNNNNYAKAPADGASTAGRTIICAPQKTSPERGHFLGTEDRFTDGRKPAG